MVKIRNGSVVVIENKKPSECRAFWFNCHAVEVNCN